MQAHSLTTGVSGSRRTWRYLEIGWLLIVAKCLAVPWVVSRWQVPVHPGWVIVPTLILASVVTLIAIVWREE